MLAKVIVLFASTCRLTRCWVGSGQSRGSSARWCTQSLLPSREWDRSKLFLERAAVDVLWEMPDVVWERAGRAMGEYARMRRSGALPRRVVADFLIGAHAEHHGLVLATFDRVVCEAVFGGVRLIF